MPNSMSAYPPPILSGDAPARAPKGNRCGHNPKKPRLHTKNPLGERTGQGGWPRLLTLAAERSKIWYARPHRCPALERGTRQVRSERREACQRLLEAVFILMDLASLRLGQPTVDYGFVPVSMQAIAETAGLHKRRCERAMRDLIAAGFVSSKQPRRQDDDGNYYGLVATRTVKRTLFERLGLSKILQKESRRKSQELKALALRAGKKLSDLVNRVGRAVDAGRRGFSAARQRDERARRWNLEAARPEYWDLPADEAKRRINAALGLPQGYTPGSA